jgi:methionyl-tRNA formyltransferase
MQVMRSLAVYSQPPRPKGRGQQVQKSPVHLYAEENGIPVYNPKSLKNADAQEEFKKLNADVAVVAAYGLILPKAVLDAPKYGCINIHASLLPRWRGASPIQHAIWSGDSETGITLMQMDEGLDTGAVITMERIAITDKTTSSSLHDELSALGGKMIMKAIDELAKNGALKSTAERRQHLRANAEKRERKN